MITIAACYSHFGAIRYKKCCDDTGIRSRLMPVPRSLSSSCGTCVRCEGDTWLMPEGPTAEEIEQIVEVTDRGYTVLWKQP